MKTSRINIASIRKEQIVEAAVAVIAEQGLHNLSLSEIENKAGMKRGQLTYYFKHKEDILLAVFDRVLQLMYQRLGKAPGMDEEDVSSKSGWVVTKYLLEALLVKPPISSEFHCLQYTFLSQIGYREDFRQRLAMLYDEWRTKMAEGLAADFARHTNRPKASPRAIATLIQALLHGLSMQRAADPESYDGPEMVDLCVEVLGSYLGLKEEAQASHSRKAATKPKPANGARSRPTNGVPVESKR
jgi:AcrR family transcriptional regulator